MARVGTCLECKRPDMSIVGRGLCGKCYHKFKKAGTLDEKYPPFGGSTHEIDEPAESRPTKKQESKPEGVERQAATSQPEKPQKSRDFIKSFRPEAVEKGDTTMVPLHFTARDTDLLEFLKSWATDERRTLDQQILAVLDNAKTAAA